jgi:hypothetical protein
MKDKGEDRYINQIIGKSLMKKKVREFRNLCGDACVSST